MRATTALSRCLAGVSPDFNNWSINLQQAGRRPAGGRSWAGRQAVQMLGRPAEGAGQAGRRGTDAGQAGRRGTDAG